MKSRNGRRIQDAVAAAGLRKGHPPARNRAGYYALLAVTAIWCSAGVPRHRAAPVAADLKASRSSLPSVLPARPGSKVSPGQAHDLAAWVGFPSDKLDPVLFEAWHLADTKGLQVALDKLAAMRTKLTEDGREVVVMVALTPDAAAAELEHALTANGGSIVCSGPTAIKAAMPLDRLDEIANLSGVAHIRNLYPPRAKNTAMTEGIPVTLANAWHSAGFGGQGVKVAVVDLGFANLSTLKAMDEIPASAPEINYTAESMTSGTSVHGCAAAEVIYDMAPNAELHVIKVDDVTDLVLVKNYCIQQGIDIVSCSLGWDALNFHDGVAYANSYTGVADHPVTAVNGAALAGVLWVTAAGNEQLQHSRIEWRDANADDYLDWSGSQDPVNLLWKEGSSVLIPGDYVNVYLTWNRWPTTTEDFDLYLWRDTGSGWEQVTSSENWQDGTAGSYPVEEIYYEVDAPGEYAVSVRKYSSTTSPTFILRCYGVDEPQYFGYGNTMNPVGGSLSIPGDAAEAFTVGALDHLDYLTGPIDYYSSLGPNNRAYTGGAAVTKPDLCGPVWVTTESYGTEAFGGTSAATPHIAGLAALVKGVHPAFTVAQLKQFLESNAFDLGTVGKDNTYGSGASRLPSPVGPELQIPEIGLDGLAILRWTSVMDQQYTLYQSTNPTAGAAGFSVLQGGIPATPPMNVHTDSVSGVALKLWRVSADQ